MEPNKVDHKLFQGFSKISERMYIAHFPVGYWQSVPEDVKQAEERISKALSDLRSDIAAIREWRGGVTHYHPLSQAMNPEITDALVAEMHLAVEKANPDWRIESWWEYGQHGLNGVSIRIIYKE